MLFQVLGPLEVHAAAVHRIGAGKRATVLTTLLLQPNTWVPVSRLFANVWPGSVVPDSADANLKTYVWQLRRILPDFEDGPRIEGRVGAYRLRSAPDELDADVAGTLAGRARRAAGAGDDAGAIVAVREALALWRGRPYAGVETTAAGAVVRLEELQLQLRELLAELQSRLGRGAEAVATLREITVDAPLREAAWARLVRALHAIGLRTDALLAYQQAQRVLAAELGVAPGAALAEAHRLVRGVRPAVRTRRELPRDVRLVGRAAELAVSLRPTRLLVVAGMAGVGKTALAVHVAHRLAPDHPDGQFFVDLRGGAVRPATVLDRLLRGIGVPAADIPGDTDERSALWRSEASRRRLLVVLDNVRDGDQLAPLLTAAAGCRTVVTTGNGGWHPAGATRTALEPLGEGAATALFVAAAGRPGTGPGDAAVTTVVRHCGGLPAALLGAAARLRTRPHWTVRRLADELDDDPCASLGDVRRSIAATCERLSGRELAAWRALGALPTEFGAVAGGRVMGVPSTAARAALETLVDRGLLGVVSADRYRSHGLVRHLAGCDVAPVSTLRREAGTRRVA